MKEPFDLLNNPDPLYDLEESCRLGRTIPIKYYSKDNERWEYHYLLNSWMTNPSHSFLSAPLSTEKVKQLLGIVNERD